MRVRLSNLKRQYCSIREEITSRMEMVMERQDFILGSEVKELESTMATIIGTEDAVGVSSGTDALLMCLMAEGIGQGDEVIVPGNSFIATVDAVCRVGATPVFVDIDKGKHTLSPDNFEKAISARTKAVIPVHLFGRMVRNMDVIRKLADLNSIIVIEDAAQSILASYRGCKAGSMGHYGCLSFFPSKNLGCFGDGGMITTDRERAAKLRKIRVHGASSKYHHSCIGGNFRLDTLQAAVLLAKLPYLKEWTNRRIEIADQYCGAILGIGHGIKRPDTPWRSPEYKHVFNQFVVMFESKVIRDHVKSELKLAGIDTAIYYPVPLYKQECFGAVNSEHYPNSDALSEKSLALPIYPELTNEEVQYVTKSFEEIICSM